MFDLEKHCCFLPEAVFMLGARYEWLNEAVREADRRKNLSLRNIVDATPPVWVHLDGFYFGRRMVTNGEYLRFIDDRETSGDGSGRFYDSAGLWQHVWANLNLGLETARVFHDDANGEVLTDSEDYNNCRGFLDAYLKSLRYEILRTLRTAPSADEARKKSADDQEDDAQPGPTSSELVIRVFAAIKHLLRQSLSSEEDSVLSEDEQRLMSGYKDPKALGNDIRHLQLRVSSSATGRGEATIGSGSRFHLSPLEPVLFLERVRLAVRNLESLAQPVSLSKVLFPRAWSAAKKVPAGEWTRNAVPWDDRPVYGVTLYEAAAYTAWLSKVEKINACLPNEAEHERAASWPAEPPVEEEGAVILDPARKAVFPWQEHSPADFHQYFGREGEDLEKDYFVKKERYETLLADTSREVSATERLHQLQGFGWHWTVDRYDINERKYHRFNDPEYPLYVDPQGRTFRQAGDAGQVPKVFEYRPYTNQRSWHFVLKGSPPILGGPGLTIRRYAAYPLRAYPNVGFTILVRPEER